MVVLLTVNIMEEATESKHFKKKKTTYCAHLIYRHFSDFEPEYGLLQ